MSKSDSRRLGFTLIELLVVIAIIAVLIGLLLPAVQKVREAAARTKCQNNMKQLALGLHNYENTYGVFPPGASMDGPEVSGIPRAGAEPRAPWTVAILPYIEQQARYDLFNQDQQFFTMWSCSTCSPSSTNRSAAQPRNIAFECPSDPNSNNANANNNYFGIQGGCSPLPTGRPFAFTPNSEGCLQGDPFFKGYVAVSGPLHVNSKVKIATIQDGTSNTFLIGESRYMQTNNGFVGGIWWTWASGMNMAWGTHPIGDNRAAEDGNKYRYKVLLAATVYQPNILPYNVSEKNEKSPGGSADNGGDYMTRYSGSYHTGGAYFALCDGSVQFISDSIEQAVFQQAGRMSDGQPVGGLNQ